jgi:murein DD-endopeptidase MepM/ murein hydrolase activator NlpD
MKFLLLFMLLFLPFSRTTAQGWEGGPEEIEALQDEINSRRAELDFLEQRKNQFESVIQELSSKGASLANELAILENRIARSELDLHATEIEIQSADKEIRLIELSINERTREIQDKKELLGSLLRDMHAEGEVTTFSLLFSGLTFAQLFDEFSQLETLQADLSSVLEDTQKARQELEEQWGRKQEKIVSLEVLEQKIIEDQERLEQARGGKELILFETQRSEAEYQNLIYELREEEQIIQHTLQTLERDIEQRILDSDALGDVSLLTLPFNGDPRVTAMFHDPDYPFRHLFEHSGTDFAMNQGSPVLSAAPGYVAFAKQGRGYGNYVMVIHGSGIATLYAHLSRIDVTPDQFVARGEPIGLSGGIPGTPGAGFSTGAHLHFEVRLDGIPVDAMEYLVL